MLFNRLQSVTYLLAMLLAPSSAAGDPAPLDAAQTHVLVLHSNRRDTEFSRLADRELPGLIEDGLARPVDYHSEYVDQPRFSEPGYAAAFREFLRHKYKAVPLDVVVTMHATAIEAVRSYRDELFSGTPMVFLANDAPPAIPNSTGVIASRRFAGTIALAVALQPDLRNVFVVTGANSSDRAFEQIARSQLQPFASKLTFTYLSGLATADLNARLARLPAHSMVYYLLVYQDGAGHNFNPLEYLESVARSAAAPTYSWVDSTMDRGIVGGSLLSQSGQLDAVAALVLRVLRGEAADDIPRSTPDLYVPQVDWRQLRRWGISEKRVPSGVLVKFKRPDEWDRYKAYVPAAMVVLMAQSLLILGLFVQKRRRRRAETAVREREAGLRTSYDRIRDLGGRLLSAQEAERARVARELHDDVGQQMALLSIDLDLLRTGQQQSHGGGALIAEACARARDIATSVHDLSHQLHPARLRMLGLVQALQGLQREVSRPGFDVDVRADDVPTSLPHDVSLCLYRIVQEALQNALVHGHASGVAIDLRGAPAGLALTIADDGVGFDVDQAWQKGLGLLSMRERLEQVGGSLDVQSHVGAGSRLSIYVPFTPEGSAASAKA